LLSGFYWMAEQEKKGACFPVGGRGYAFLASDE
jgi:hypothetical protein